ncbi:hypothetical protein AYO44_13915 [Planctomycetaceae bacterium SCGC AG-212-F19]|nr:hypothetical protein AYO44_13915 [Planctomycetaceae bacterium SCGC AG-212-F19]
MSPATGGQALLSKMQQESCRGGEKQRPLATLERLRGRAGRSWPGGLLMSVCGLCSGGIGRISGPPRLLGPGFFEFFHFSVCSIPKTSI